MRQASVRLIPRSVFVSLMSVMIEPFLYKYSFLLKLGGATSAQVELNKKREAEINKYVFISVKDEK